MANPKHLEILKQGTDSWNQWRKDFPEIIPDLEELNLDFANLENANLGNVNFKNSSLKNANLYNTFLVNANLENCMLCDAKLVNANLENVNLKGSDLKGANLDYASLYRAKLEDAKLINASLKNAYLYQTNLEGANLENVILRKANLRKANLKNANLKNAYLYDTDFGYANLDNVNLTNADVRGIYFYNTAFSNLDLSKVLNLEFIKHYGPSNLATNCFQKSKGNIPSKFLAGIGLTDYEIESVKLGNPNLTPTEITEILYKMDELRNESPIQIHKLFISYSHHDAAFVNAIEPLFKKRNIRFWRDVHDATAGPIDKILVRAIQENQISLLILSRNSVHSDWVEFEMAKAREVEKDLGRHVICPIALDQKWTSNNWSPILWNQIRKYNILDFSDWQNKTSLVTEFAKLVRGLDLYYKDE